MESLLECMNPILLSEKSYQKIDVLDSCLAAIREGVGDLEVITMTSSYTQSLVMEILENAKEFLLKLYQQIVSLLNNFILNTANLADKYRNLLIDRLVKMKEPFVFKTYEYPKLKDRNYPAIFKSSASVEDAISKLEESIISDNMMGSQVEDAAYKILKQFGRDVLDAEVTPYGDFTQSIKDAVDRHVRGKQVTRKLTQRDINTFIDEICKHKEFRDDLARTKNNMIDDYIKLKKTYMASLKRSEAELLGIKAMKYPEMERLKADERDRFASINLSMTQMFNGFITIYREAFNRKLVIMQEKVEINRQVITELMGRTNVLTTVAAKIPDKKVKPFVFDPGVKT